MKPGSAGPDITFDAADAALYDSYRAQQGTVKPVHAGLVLSQLQLMQVVLVSSANNYADSLARWAFGSRAAFLAATKAWLAAHSLTGTTLLEPTGMNPGNTSTASDLVPSANSSWPIRCLPRSSPRSRSRCRRSAS